MTLHIDTPLAESRQLSASSGRSVWMKLDALQPSGSFKIRGIGFACETYRARGAYRSGSNHRNALIRADKSEK
jgi:L-serine/L-threonine ammonia-lyase